MDHLAGWRDESARFVEVLAGADLAAHVPGCPEWDVADLAYHVGWVLDRFRRIADDRLTEKDQVRELGSVERPEDDAMLPAWFRDRVGELDPVLAGLGPDEPVWNFTRAPHDGAWVHRRMHLEMVVHRHDLEEAVGEASPIDVEVARDGVDELLRVLSTVGKRWPENGSAASLQVVDGEAGVLWHLDFEPGERAVPGWDRRPADVLIEGAPVPLLLALWRRRSLDTVTMTGDGDVAEAMLATIGR